MTRKLLKILSISIKIATLTSALMGLTHTTHGQTLAEAVKTTLDVNPAAAAACFSERATYEAMLASKGQLLPQANVTLSGGRQRTTVFTSVSSSSITTLSPYSANFTIKQLLFDGNATYNTYRAAQQRRNASHFENQNVQNRLAFSTATSYLDIIRFRQIKKLSIHNVDVHKNVMGNAQRRYDSGAGQKADLELVQARLSLAESRLELFQTQLENSRVSYFELTGTNPGALYVPTIPADMLPEKFGTIGFCGNPEIQRSVYEMQAAKLDNSVATAKLVFPRFEFDFSYLNGNDLSGNIGQFTDVRGLFVLSYDLFKGGSDYARVQEACARKNEARERLINTQLIVERDGNIAWNSIQATVIRVKELQNYVDYLGLVLDAYRKQYDLNQRSMLNLLDIENELFNAAVSLVNEKMDQLKSVYELFTNMGNIIPAIMASTSASDAAKIEINDDPLPETYKRLPNVQELNSTPVNPPPGFNPPSAITNPSPTAPAMQAAESLNSTAQGSSATPMAQPPVVSAQPNSVTLPNQNQANSKSAAIKTAAKQNNKQIKKNSTQTGSLVACPFCSATLPQPKDSKSGKTSNGNAGSLVACPFCSATLPQPKDSKSGKTNNGNAGGLVACPFCSANLDQGKDSKSASSNKEPGSNGSLVACPFCSASLEAPDSKTSKSSQPQNTQNSPTLAMDDESELITPAEKDKNSTNNNPISGDNQISNEKSETSNSKTDVPSGGNSTLS